MLSERKILEFLFERKDEYTTASLLADTFKVSLRTVHNDLKVVKDFSDLSNVFEITTVSAKGSFINVEHEEDFLLLINENISKEKTSLDTRENRVKKIIAILVSARKGISLYHLESRLYISRSTLMEDLKHARKILAKYSLSVENTKDYGLVLKGDEVDIRNCILKENINVFSHLNSSKSVAKLSPIGEEISDIVFSVLTKEEYKILDVSLQNLIVHLDVSIFRIMKGYTLENNYFKKDIGLGKEVEIAKNIFRECEKRFNININENEAYRIAIYLKAKSNYKDESYITEDIDNFVLESFKVIEDKYNISFVNNIQLRISLALHILPLQMRLKHDMQLENALLVDVKQNYQLAYSIASLFCVLLQKKIGYDIKEDEVSFFALYFNNAIEESLDVKGKHDLLILSSLRRSESLLLVGRLKSKLKEDVSNVMVINYTELDDYDVKKYSLICSTESEYINFVDEDVLLISSFPTEIDLTNIKKRINIHTSKETFLSLFKEENTIIDVYDSKEQLIMDLTKLIDKHENCDYDLFEQVIAREAMGGTYYGNKIAMPHTLHPITKNTYIGVGLLKEGLKWDNFGNEVNLVLLILFEKDNFEIYKLWSIFSPLIFDESIIRNILEDMTFENFMTQMGRTFELAL